MELPVAIEVARKIARGAARRVHTLLSGMMALDDLESEAWVGLLRALPHYQADKSRFSTFAGQRCYWHLIDYARECSWLPRSAVAKVRAGLLAKPKPWRSLDALARPVRDGARIGGDDVARVADADQVGALLSRVKARDRQILTLYWLRGMTMRQVGKAINLSESRVSQILSGAMERLKERYA